MSILGTEDYSAMMGVTKPVFGVLWTKFCGNESVINSQYVPTVARTSAHLLYRVREKLFELLYFMKANPRHRQLKVLCGRRSLGSFYKTLYIRVRHLAHALQPVREQCWQQRYKAEMPWDDFCGTGCFGIVDTMPIFIRRPKLPNWSRATYQGKYKAHVVKMQLINDDQGLPLFWSGPHAGVRSDIRVWRDHGPTMAADDFVLGDKAYQGAPDVISPYKRPRGGQLSRHQKDYNTVHS
jgi:hypothetical protein